MNRILALWLIFQAASCSAEGIPVQGRLDPPDPVIGAQVDILLSGVVASTAAPVDLIPDENGVFSAVITGFNPVVFQISAFTEIRFKSQGQVIAQLPINAVPLALAVRGTKPTDNVMGSTDFVGVGTLTPSEKLTVAGGFLKFSTPGTGIKWADGSVTTRESSGINMAVLQLINGNKATTSISYTNVPDSLITLKNVGAGSPVLYTCNLVVADNTAETYVEFQAQIDGVPIFPDEVTLAIYVKNNGDTSQVIPNDIYQNSFVLTTPPLTAGTHTFSLKFRRGIDRGTTSVVMANSIYPLRCMAMEIR